MLHTAVLMMLIADCCLLLLCDSLYIVGCGCKIFDHDCLSSCYCLCLCIFLLPLLSSFFDQWTLLVVIRCLLFPLNSIFNSLITSCKRTISVVVSFSMQAASLMFSVWFLSWMLCRSCCSFDCLSILVAVGLFFPLFAQVTIWHHHWLCPPLPPVHQRLLHPRHLSLLYNRHRLLPFLISLLPSVLLLDSGF